MLKVWMCIWLWNIPLYLLMGHQHSLHPVIPGYHLFHFLQGSCQDFYLQSASSRNMAALSTQALELSVETVSLFSVSHNNLNCVLIFFHFGLIGLVSPSRAWIYYLQEQTPNVLCLNTENTEGLLSPHVLLWYMWCSTSQGWRVQVTSHFCICNLFYHRMKLVESSILLQLVLNCYWQVPCLPIAEICLWLPETFCLRSREQWAPEPSQPPHHLPWNPGTVRLGVSLSVGSARKPVSIVCDGCAHGRQDAVPT